MEGVLVLAVLVALFSPFPHLDPAKLAEFDRVLKGIGADVYIVDVNGTERVGRLMGATRSGLRLRVAAGELSIDKDAVAEVDRRRDSSLDGAIKGAVLGALMGMLADGGNNRLWLTSTAVYAGIGFALDAAVSARQPLYRARPPASLVVRLKW